LPKLSPVSWRDLVKHLRQLGFVGPYEGGRHPYMVRGDVVVTLPNPHRGDISVDLLQRILRRAGISREEYLAD
jgi:predicted RNA binding protein YcfA (HicA-like mRNA interferase family)